MTSNRRQGRRDRDPNRTLSAPDPIRLPLAAALSAAVLLELLIGLLPPSNWSWGANLLHYYPAGAAVAWAALTLALVWWPARGRAPDGAAPITRLSPAVVALFAGIAALLCLHALRSQSHLLGDGYEVIRRLRQGNTPAPRSPLFNLFAPVVFRAMGGVGADGGGAAAGWFAILAGAITVAVVAFVAVRILRRGHAGGGAALALLVLTPLLQIFAGYVESYASFHAAAILFFAFAFDRLTGGGVGALAGATAALVIALASHPFAATLVPGWLLLAAAPVTAKDVAPGTTRRRLLFGAGALAAVTLALTLLFAVRPELRASNNPWRYASPQELAILAWKLFHNAFGTRPWAHRHTIASTLHVSDVLNTAWLVGAPGIAVLLGLLVRPEGRRALGSLPARVALLALPLALFSRSFLRTPLGASRDWDVFAGLGLGCNAVAAGALLGLGRGGWFRPVAAVGLFFALPYLGIQMSVDRSARRHFDAIEAEPRPEPFLESGYHGVMGDRFADLGQYGLATRAYERSLAVFPRKDYAWRLGTVEMAQRHYDRAVRALTQTIALDPDHREAMTELGNALNGLGRFAAADSVLARTIERYPAESGLAMVYRARARFLMGDSSGGNEWLTRAEQTLPPEDAGRKDLKRLRDEVADAIRAGASASPGAGAPAGTPPTPR